MCRQVAWQGCFVEDHCSAVEHGSPCSLSQGANGRLRLATGKDMQPLVVHDKGVAIPSYQELHYQLAGNPNLFVRPSFSFDIYDDREGRVDDEDAWHHATKAEEAMNVEGEHHEDTN